jgi:hypothetical protein
MMKADGGGSIVDNIIHNGKRQSAYRSYVYPRLLQKNLTVLTGALTTRILFDGSRASGIEFVYNGQLHQAKAKFEIVLSQGAIQTPKLLMQSGIGDQEELKKFGIPVRQHLPGVGRNMHDHVALACLGGNRRATAADSEKFSRGVLEDKPSTGCAKLLHLWNRHSVPYPRERSEVSTATGRMDALHRDATRESRIDSFDGDESFRPSASGSELPCGTKRSRRSQGWRSTHSRNW